MSIEIADDGLKLLNGPIARHMDLNSAGFKFANGVSGDRLRINKSDFDQFIVRFAWAINTEGALMNITESLETQYEAAKKLWDNYDARMKSFRASVRNDITSVEASSRKTTEAVGKILNAYGEVIQLLNSKHMEVAILNAERLASALKVIENAQARAISISVRSGDSL